MYKTCKKCGRALDATSIYFHRDKADKDGFFCYCKECRGGSFGVTRGDIICEEGYQICTRCNRTLPSTIEYFHRNIGSKSGYNHVCRECRGYKFGEIQRAKRQGKCMVAGCDKQDEKKNYCEKHYRMWRKYGDPLHERGPTKQQLSLRECYICGTMFATAYRKVRYPDWYCSVKCSREDGCLGRQDNSNNFGQKCSICGKTFMLETSKKYSHCSKLCYIADVSIQRREKAIRKTKACVICGKAYVQKSGRDSNVYCSRECYQRGHTGKCGHCKKEFVGVTGQQYCSQDCRDKVYWEEKGRYKNRMHQHERKVAFRNAKSEKIDCIKVFERDRWYCQICGKKVNPKLKHPHPKSATIDHVVPVKKGGSHTYDNVQLAHFVCNNRKSDRNIMPNEEGQLMIV